MPNPLITVIIPLKKITVYLIKENLPALSQQIYKDFEVIVLPNKKENGDQSLLQKYKWLRIIPTGKRTRPAEKRDIGAKNAKGKILAFIDDDAFPQPQWLEKAVEIFQKSHIRKPKREITVELESMANFKLSIAAVCGPGLLPHYTNIWEKIFDEVFKTWIGAGGYSYRFLKQKERFVDDYPSMNFLIQKRMFNKLGGFNSEYWPGEDSKLCDDLVYKEKQKILYHPDVAIYHHRRDNLKGYLKQHANYGFHRGAFFAHRDKNSLRIGYLVPTLFVAYIVTLISLYSLSTFYPFPKLLLRFSIIPLLLYIAVEFYLFVKTLINTKNVKISAGLALVLFLTHAVYGILFVKGFLFGLIKKDKIYSS